MKNILYWIFKKDTRSYKIKLQYINYYSIVKLYSFLIILIKPDILFNLKMILR